MSKSKRIAAAVSVGLGAVLLTVSPAGATQLSNPHGALACKEYKISAQSKVQACTDVVTVLDEEFDEFILGKADATAYKKVKIDGVSQWVQDDSVEVSMDQVSVFADGEASAAIGLPSGPQPGYAWGITRQTGTQDGSVAHSAFSRATLGVWENGVEIKTIQVQSNTVTIPPQG